MQEKNSNHEIKRPTAEKPDPMQRREKPIKPASNPYLGLTTPAATLTEEQKQPLSAREKPQPSEAVFPRPLPAKKVSAQTHTQLKAATITVSAEPMKRHEAVKLGKRADWKYTSSETVAPSPEERVESHAKAVPAAVVKMPIDKKPIVLSVIAIFLALVIILGCVFGIKSVDKGGIHDWNIIQTPEDEPPVEYPDDWEDPPQMFPSQNVTISDSFSKDSAILSPAAPEEESAISNDYASKSLVGFSSEVVRTLDTTEIVKPTKEVTNEGLTESLGLSRYPGYGSTPSGVIGTSDTAVALRNALIAESAYVASANTSHNSGASTHPYNMMDSAGNLLFVDGSGNKTASLDDSGKQRVLYKHTCAEGLYGGNVSDDEPRIVKKVTMRIRGYNGYGVTGLYAPAGEVIKIEISKKDMDATGGLTIHIGQALYNGQANNIWTAKNQMPRFPVILNTMLVNKLTAEYNNETETYTAYVGSFLGGPLYIRNTNAKFTATISGCVKYSHFILGYTTEAEFEDNKKSTAPYFDLEVWDKGVLHSGPRSYANSFTYDQLYKVAVLWEKVATVTTTAGAANGIVFIYDPFVAAGAAVAFPGRRSVNCPAGWMSGALNYNGIVSSGSWGNFHEYHHNFQNYGVGDRGEVTNNALTLVSYSLFTKISSNRGIGNYGLGSLGGWNRYTCATWPLQRVLDGQISSTNGLAVYATLLHNLGQDAFIRARGYSGVSYWNRWQDITHQNMQYYADLVSSYGGSYTLAENDYPMFVPVSCVYQTGRSYTYDGQKKYFKTMQPYVIPAATPFNIDLSKYSAPDGQYAGGSIVIPDGFEYRIKSVSGPASGKGRIEIVDNYNLKYTPNTPDPSNPSTLRSGQIVVTLEIIKTDGAFKVDDVDLILEFEQSYNTNKMTLERTIHTYSAENMPTDARVAYESNFAGSTAVTINHSNPTQNCNTDVWFYPDTPENRAKYPNAPDHYFIQANQVVEISGKLYFEEEGRYRIYLRGRRNCALYVSLDGTFTDKNEKDKDEHENPKPFKVAYINDNITSANFRPTDANTYIDLDLGEKSWVYFKEVLIVNPEHSSFIGLGTSSWTETMFTMEEKYYNGDKVEIPSPDDADYQYTETTYNNYAGTAVAVVVTNKGSAAPTYYKIVNGNRVLSNQNEVSELTAGGWAPPTAAPSYVNAYRSSFEFIDNGNFETDYFYVRSYNYNYVGDAVSVLEGKTPQLMTDVSNYVPWDASLHNIDNLFSNFTATEDAAATGIFFASSWGVSANKPAILAFDIGEEITANSMVLYLYKAYGNNLGNRAFPSNFKLEGSLNGIDWFDMGAWSNQSAPEVSSEFTFNGGKAFTFRYYKLTVTASMQQYGGRVALNGMEFRYSMRLTGNGANFVAPDNAALVYKGSDEDAWEKVTVQSNFGYAYKGTSGSEINFTMKGTRLAILTNSGFANQYEVYIDGVLCPSVDVKNDDGDFAVTYISQLLASGEHSVRIVCTDETCFDSFAIYDET